MHKQTSPIEGIMNAKLSLSRRATEELPQKSDDERKFREWLGGNAQSRQKVNMLLWLCNYLQVTEKLPTRFGNEGKARKVALETGARASEKICRATQTNRTSFPLSEYESRVAHPECADWNCIKVGLSTSPDKEACNSFGFLFKLQFAIIHCARVYVLVQLHPFYDRLVGVFSTPSLPVAGEVSRIALTYMHSSPSLVSYSTLSPYRNKNDCDWRTRKNNW